MFSPEDQQMSISLLSHNFENLENDLASQEVALPNLDAENEQNKHLAIAALRAVRSLNAAKEKLTEENMQLLAKRMQLKRQCEDMALAIENSDFDRQQLQKQLTAEDDEVDQIIRKYQDFTDEISERFINSRIFYKEEEITQKTGKVEQVIFALTSACKRAEEHVVSLRDKLGEVMPCVPADILNILGKQELENEIKQITDKYNALKEKRNTLVALMKK